MPVGKATRRSQPRGQSSFQVSPARAAAFRILRRVEEESAYSSVLLASSLDELNAQDRGLCYELVMGVLRHQLWLDALIEHYATRATEKLDLPVRVALRLGLYQLRFLTRIPASAAVNESVNLVRAARLRSAESFANAVLRRATREPDYDPAAEIQDPLEKLSVETSHPLWLIKRWANLYGIEETANFARANNETPPVAFRVVGQRAESSDILEELRGAGAALEPSKIAPDAWRVRGVPVLVRSLAQSGRIYLQDEASQLVTYVLDARGGESILDVCAAPGSKTTHIAGRADDRVLVIAGDIYEHRLRVLLESAARQNLSSIRAVNYDAGAALPFRAETFDRVLVDAPCTGTGTLSRNSEIRWRVRAEEIAQLSLLQQRILTQAARVVRRGGRLVYSTCSVESEEDEQVTETFLQEHPSFRQIDMDVQPAIKTPQGFARTWPQRDGTDGFFIAAFERAS